jgi:hemoglobin
MDDRPTLFEHAGGEPAMLALARAHHVRCLADPELNHPFSHADLNPEHVTRLAAYWTQVLGGPPRWTEAGGTQSEVLTIHAGHGDMSDLGRRFVDCFCAAMDDAGLPDDEPFRTALRAYMEQAVVDVLAFSPVDAVVPRSLPMPRWSWDGMVPADQ